MYDILAPERAWPHLPCTGFKDEFGQPVNMSVELDKMLTVAPTENKQAILRAMSQFAPPPRTAPKKGEETKKQ